MPRRQTWRRTSGATCEAEPIRARKINGAERSWRWARRNPMIAVLGGLLAAVLMLVTVGSLLAARRFARVANIERSLRLEANQARDEARRQEKEAIAARDRANVRERSERGSVTARASPRPRPPSSCRIAVRGSGPSRTRRRNTATGSGVISTACSRVRASSFPSPGSAPRRVSFSPDSRQIAVVSDKGDALLFDVATGRPGPASREAAERVVSLEYSPDGRHLAGGASDGTIRIWSLESGRERLVLRGAKSALVQYRPDGKRLVSSEGAFESGEGPLSPLGRDDRPANRSPRGGGSLELQPWGQLSAPMAIGWPPRAGNSSASTMPTRAVSSRSRDRARRRSTGSFSAPTASGSSSISITSATAGPAN